MQRSKISLSPAERELFNNAEVILTKNAIVQKTVALLSELQTAMQEEATSFIRTASPPPKISKGENYLGLPYVVLDYPRIAGGENLFFIRSFFWWGNFYSSTLQLTGDFKQRHQATLAGAYNVLVGKGYSVGIHADPWQHHFGDDNYKSMKELSAPAYQTVLEEMPYIKIAARWPLNEWDAAAERLMESWRFLTALVA